MRSNRLSPVLLLFAVLVLLLAGCALRPPKPVPLLQPVAWEQLDGWWQDETAKGLATFRNSCRSLQHKQSWQQVCAEAELVLDNDASARIYFAEFFQPYQVNRADGSTEGLLTGYYGAELAGCRQQTERCRYPLYRSPDDMLTIDLSAVYPELKKYRLRGRLQGNKVVPYYDRDEIDQPLSPLAGNELFWVEDPVELFYLQIQGSGRIRFADGSLQMVGYDNQNGHPFRSIGQLLLERKIMTRNQMSMENIRSWVAENPEDGARLLAENPSYVFFRELSDSYITPPGAMGIALTERRSLAVDRHEIPLGAPVFLATHVPASEEPMNRLMVAQDVGGAIKGRLRADFFWGVGEEAGKIARRTKQAARMWLLLPKDFDLRSLERH